MNADQIGGIIRAILAAVGGLIIGKGWVDAQTWAWIVGGVAVAVPAVWSWFTNRPASIAAKAQAIDGVNVQTTANAPADVKAAVSNAKSGA